MTINQTTARGGLARIVPTAAAMVVGAALVIATPTDANGREARDSTPSSVTAYSEPQPALGGRSLAQYVAEHVAHVLGPFDV